MTQSDTIGTRLLTRVGEVVKGQHAVVEFLVAALAARAHVLLEGPPGTAKTLMAWSVANSVGLSFARVQLTPDLMPSDLLGSSVWLPHEGRFEFHQGPLFTEVLLADELNRAPPKTQAALLEAMQERQVTYDGVTRQLGDAFWVVATQNPLEQEGTYPLPESELDRFALKLRVDYPTTEADLQLLRLHQARGDALDHVKRSSSSPLLSSDELRAWRDQVRQVRVDDSLLRYIQTLVASTRSQPDLAWGAGPRAAVALLDCGRALALVRSRDYVVPDDVIELLGPVLAHRLRVAPEALVAGVTVSDVLARVVAAITVPSSEIPPS